ncbi:MAG: bifunctional folylpolyglutamate synthase/dihydrofolate synthase [Bacteroidales bacterium]|nr:bifunctional folylpolyglutamate synthase/dihydrofolate synthase [Bacteroidales bacterium]
MDKIFSESAYDEMIQRLFCRFPSFQKVGAGAYKPGTANMEFADQLMGHPHRKYRIVHVAGTNGKGSVSNMLASVLSASGLKVGLYTSPHIIDFRERIRVVPSCSGRTEESSFSLISKEDVWSFVSRWHETFDHLDLSFFEITTLMALDWFARQEVDIVVLETGLGGRLDSTNIVTPVLSVITNIGLDHCDMLGDTLPEIAFEKAGIIKPKVPAVIGESDSETDPVFERKVLYTNISEPEYMGNRSMIMSLLTFADKVTPSMWEEHEDILTRMDLRGEYQRKNLRTVLAAFDVLSAMKVMSLNEAEAKAAIVHTARRTGFGGRWETLSDEPYVICDIGHNGHGLKYNFAQLARMKAEGECSDLIVVYGSVADKDVDSVIHLMPRDAVYVFTQASSKRALPAEVIKDKYLNHCASAGVCPSEVHCRPSVPDAVAAALAVASEIKKGNPSGRPLIYIGGSTYVVSEAVAVFR